MHTPRTILILLLSAVMPLARGAPNALQTLESRVEQLERRLAELEQPAAAPSPTATNTLEVRVSRLEEQMAPLADPGTLQVSWRNGITFRSADQAFNLQLGGRVQNDFAFFSTDDDALEAAVGPLEDGVEFRRARLELGGTMYDQGEFKAQYDFSDGSPGFRYVYFGLREVPLAGTLRVGHMQEPFGLEQLTSSKYITFLERGLTTAFAPSYNTGIMNLRSLLEQRATLSLGVFRETDNFGEASSDDGYHFTGRATALPLDAQEGRRLIHVGAAASQQSLDKSELRYRSKPESGLAPLFVDTDTFAADDATLVGLEAAAVFGAFSLQGEYMSSATEADSGADADFAAHYVQASYLLTGEHRPYDRSSGVFARVRPNRNFTGPTRGPGAWELAARASSIDLTDGEVVGGEMDNVSGALNWYLNPNMRVMLNYVHADLRDAGVVHVAQTRFQVDF